MLKSNFSFLQKITMIFIVGMLIISIPIVALAENFDIEDYDVIIKVNSNNTYEIQETLNTNFFDDYSHGIYRTIPTYFTNQRAIISDISVNNEYTKTTSATDTTLKIGDPDNYANRNEIYKIDYLFDMGDDNIDEYDQFYFNIIGSQWETNIHNVTFKVILPENIDRDSIHITSGGYGIEDNSKDVTFLVNDNVITGQCENLYQYESITMRIVFDEGYYTNERVNRNLSLIFAIIGWIITIVLFAFLYILWKKHGKDKTVYSTVQFTAPEDMTSAEVGYIIDGIVDNKDITSLIIYWANKGYLIIEELEKNKFKFLKTEKEFIGKDYEQYMFNHFFKNGTRNTVTMEDLSGDFYTAMPSIKIQIKNEYKGQKELITKKSKLYAGLALLSLFIPLLINSLVCFSGFLSVSVFFPVIFGFIPLIIIAGLAQFAVNKWKFMTTASKISSLIFTAFTSSIVIIAASLAIIFASQYYTDMWNFGFIVSEIVRFLLSVGVIIFFSCIMKKRTDYGHEIYEKLIGLKEFIEMAEMDKLKELSEENPEYFYSILPYATVFGLENKWAKNFEKITLDKPRWYYSTSTTYFTSMAMTRSMNSCLRATNTSMAPPASKGSSGGGFSGGGFSGGGGGGGGGGSW